MSRRANIDAVALLYFVIVSGISVFGNIDTVSTSLENIKYGGLRDSSGLLGDISFHDQGVMDTRKMEAKARVTEKSCPSSCKKNTQEKWNTKCRQKECLNCGRCLCKSCSKLKLKWKEKCTMESCSKCSQCRKISTCPDSCSKKNWNIMCKKKSCKGCFPCDPDRLPFSSLSRFTVLIEWTCPTIVPVDNRNKNNFEKGVLNYLNKYASCTFDEKHNFAFDSFTYNLNATTTNDSDHFTSRKQGGDSGTGNGSYQAPPTLCLTCAEGGRRTNRLLGKQKRQELDCDEFFNMDGPVTKFTEGIFGDCRMFTTAVIKEKFEELGPTAAPVSAI